MGRQVSTSGARAYTARCPRPGRVEWSVLVSYWVWGWGASSVGRFALERFLSGGCPVCCSLRDPLGVRGFNGVGSLAIEKRASAGVVLERALQHRRAWGATVVQTWGCRCVCVVQSGRSEGLGRRWQAGWSRPGACGVRTGCAFGRGAVRRGRSKSGEKRPYPLSLSLRFVFSTLPCRRRALHLAPGAICWLAGVGSTPAGSDSVSSPPSVPVGCSADPASLTAALKGPLLGGLPIVSGLEGVCSRKGGRG